MERGNTSGAKRGLVAKLVRFHPYKTALMVAILGIAILFLFFVVAFQLTKKPDVHIRQFPKAFIVSTFVLMLSSISLGNILDLYKRDKVKAIRNNLLFTMFLGTCFLVSQLAGWRELRSNGIFLKGEVSGAYLYVISGVHMLHVTGGLIFMYVQTIHVWMKSKDAVKSLIFVTDPYEHLKLDLLRIYWHFMDILWVILFFYFLFSF